MFLTQIPLKAVLLKRMIIRQAAVSKASYSPSTHYAHRFEFLDPNLVIEF